MVVTYSIDRSNRNVSPLHVGTDRLAISRDHVASASRLKCVFEEAARALRRAAKTLISQTQELEESKMVSRRKIVSA